jgi:hypothetical protein
VNNRQLRWPFVMCVCAKNAELIDTTDKEAELMALFFSQAKPWLQPLGTNLC